MKQNSEDIDLLELFLILWKGKWVIILFVLVAVTSRWILFFFQKPNLEVNPSYETSLELLFEFIPLENNANTPLLNKHRLMSDFQKIYYSEDLFNKWKSIKDQSLIDYEYLTDTVLIDGILFKKKDTEKSIKFEHDNIIIKYNNISFLNEIIDYTNYVNDTHNSEIFSNLKEQSQMLERKYKKQNYPDVYYSSLFDKIFQIDQIINALDKGQKPINIKAPMYPVNLSSAKVPVLNFINLISFAILGAVFGAFFVFLRNALLKRQVNLSDT